MTAPSASPAPPSTGAAVAEGGAPERGIIFSAPMVRALLAGRKTQTRRLLKPQPPESARYSGVHYASYEPNSWFFNSPIGTRKVRQSFDEGDTLWVREAWKPHSTFAAVRPRDIPPSRIFYAADDAYAPSNTPWRSPIHMPRWASRLTLAVTDVRVQRLQDISEADALAEGTQEPTVRDLGGDLAQAAWSERQVYSRLWNSIHGPTAWDANPWVAAISFGLAAQARPCGAEDGVRHG